jgi:hypothetical protein
LSFVTTEGQEPRIFVASRSMLPRLASTLARQVDLVDDEQVALGDPGRSLRVILSRSDTSTT